jgi:hypothetical protein
MRLPTPPPPPLTTDPLLPHRPAQIRMAYVATSSAVQADVAIAAVNATKSAAAVQTSGNGGRTGSNKLGAPVAGAFTVTSDDAKSTANVVASYQTCTGTNIYVIDQVLVPCDFVKLAPASDDVDAETKKLAEDLAASKTSGSQQRNAAGSSSNGSSALLLAVAVALLSLLLL